MSAEGYTRAGPGAPPTIKRIAPSAGMLGTRPIGRGSEAHVKQMRTWVSLCALLTVCSACGGSSSRGDSSANASNDASAASSDSGNSDGTSGGSTNSTGTGGGSSAGSTSGGAESSAPDADSFLSQYADLLCSGLATCCESAGFAFSAAACRSFLSLADAQQSLADVSYDRQAAERCLDRLKSSAEACLPNEETICDSVFLGNAKPGDVCTQDTECAPSSHGSVTCDTPNFTSEDSICLVDVRAGLGEPCVKTCFESDSLWACSYEPTGDPPPDFEQGECYRNDGLTCDATSLRCVETRALGEPCVDSNECGANASCDSVCVAGAGEGEPCSDVGGCAPGTLCNEGTCAPEADASLEFVCSLFSDG